MKINDVINKPLLKAKDLDGATNVTIRTAGVTTWKDFNTNDPVDGVLLTFEEYPLHEFRVATMFNRRFLVLHWPKIFENIDPTKDLTNKDVQGMVGTKVGLYADEFKPGMYTLRFAPLFNEGA